MYNYLGFFELFLWIMFVVLEHGLAKVYSYCGMLYSAAVFRISRCSCDHCSAGCAAGPVYPRAEVLHHGRFCI